MIGRIAIDGLRVECVIGCLPRERTTPQCIRLDLWADVDTRPAADSDILTDALDYTALARQVTFILQQGRFQLLESAARMLLRFLLLPPAPGMTHPAVIAAGVVLTKFDVFPNGASPRLTLSATAAEQTWTRTEQPWGDLETIDVSRRVRLERLNVSPGQRVVGSSGVRLVLHGTPEDGQGCTLLRVSRVLAGINA
ncbi:MAG: FolB domain-containing protein [Myxococcota bacterium]|jgi:FolB domain-containing protein